MSRTARWLALSIGLAATIAAGQASTLSPAAAAATNTISDRAPFGVIDVVDQANGGSGIRAGGWAIDPDTTNPIAIYVYVDGQFAGAQTANAYRPDVGAAYPGSGDYHGYNLTVPANTAGTHSVCVYAINVGGRAGNPLLGCRSVTTSANQPFGFLDGVAADGASIWADGWTIDPDTTASIDVHIYVDGHFAGAQTANLYRPDVGAAYPGYGDNHGYGLHVPSGGAGIHSVCSYAINVGASAPNPQLGCKSVLTTS